MNNPVSRLICIACLVGAASAFPEGWNTNLMIQFRKEGRRSACSDEAIIGLETEMYEWLNDEIARITPKAFRLGKFHGSDSEDSAELVTRFDCDTCHTESVAEALQWSAQAVADLWIEDNDDSLLKGCMGEDTATAIRIELTNTATVE
jgi:hypothetical protein